MNIIRFIIKIFLLLHFTANFWHTLFSAQIYYLLLLNCCYENNKFHNNTTFFSQSCLLLQHQKYTLLCYYQTIIMNLTIPTKKHNTNRKTVLCITFHNFNLFQKHQKYMSYYCLIIMNIIIRFIVTHFYLTILFIIAIWSINFTVCYNQVITMNLIIPTKK